MSWPQYQRFRQIAEGYQIRSGECQSVIAGKLGLNLYTYRNYLYGSKKPGLRTLRAAARLFECSVMEFIDDPDAPPPGLDKITWSAATELERSLSMAILKDLQTVSEKEKYAYYDLCKRGLFKVIAKAKAEQII